MTSVCLQGKPFTIIVIQVDAPTTNAEEVEVEWFYEDLQDHLELTPKKDVLFIIEDQNEKVGSQKIFRVTGKFGLRVQNEVLPGEHTGHSKHPIPKAQGTILQHEHHQMVNTKIRLIVFFAAKDGEALQSQKKQDQELTVAQIMNSLLQNSDLN